MASVSFRVFITWCKKKEKKLPCVYVIVYMFKAICCILGIYAQGSYKMSHKSGTPFWACKRLCLSAVNSSCILMWFSIICIEGKGDLKKGKKKKTISRATKIKASARLLPLGHIYFYYVVCRRGSVSSSRHRRKHNTCWISKRVSLCVDNCFPSTHTYGLYSATLIVGI